MVEAELKRLVHAREGVQLPLRMKEAEGSALMQKWGVTGAFPVASIFLMLDERLSSGKESRQRRSRKLKK